MKTQNMKQFHTLCAAALMLAGSALWGGCSSDELTGNAGMETSKEAGSFSFRLNGVNTPQTRATQEAIAAEKEVKTLYVAFFTKNESENEKDSKLYRIFCYDTDGAPQGWEDQFKMTLNGSEYSIAEPGNTGNYVTYFIANPEAAIKAQLKTYKESEIAARTTLETFEKGLVAEGTAKDESRGFTMMSKQQIEIGENKRNYTITLTRLAARFDFINSAPETATITDVKFNNEAIKSNLVQDSEVTPEAYLKTGAGTEQKWPSGGENSMTLYTYENLNTNVENNFNYGSIIVSYTLSGQKKTLTVNLKEKDVALAIMRNHLYKINLNCITGTYEMTVQEWQGGETVTIPNKELAITYTADDEGKVGDYVYNNNGTLAFSDGGLRKMYLDGTLEWENTRPGAVTGKGTCVGIVFSNLTSETDQKAGYKRGYVLATKYAGKKVQWNSIKETVSEIPVFNTIQEYIKDLDGYTYCQKANKTKQEAIRVAMAHSVAIPKETSGWYLPTIGQLSVFARNITGTDGLTTKTGNLNTTQATRYEFSTPDCNKKISELFKQIPTSEFDAFDTTEGDVLWLSTSSQGPAHSARAVWDISKKIYHIKFDVEKVDHYANSRVRPVFAY